MVPPLAFHVCKQIGSAEELRCTTNRSWAGGRLEWMLRIGVTPDLGGCILRMERGTKDWNGCSAEVYTAKELGLVVTMFASNSCWRPRNAAVGLETERSQGRLVRWFSQWTCMSHSLMVWGLPLELTHPTQSCPLTSTGTLYHVLSPAPVITASTSYRVARPWAAGRPSLLSDLWTNAKPASCKNLFSCLPLEASIHGEILSWVHTLSTETLLPNTSKSFSCILGMVKRLTSYLPIMCLGKADYSLSPWVIFFP